MEKEEQLIDTIASTLDTQPDLVAQKTLGRFQILHKLGEGGMGAVYAAFDPELQRQVAIKLLHATGADEQEKMLREARGLASLSHPNVITIYDVAIDEGGSPYLVMELLEGRDLAGVLKERGPLPVVEAVDLLLQACAALSVVHPLGVVHRDLKPANLFLAENSDGSVGVKVIDFGISKLAESTPGGHVSTITGAVFGTPSYMSPEQIRSSKHVDARSDIWSLGVILHEMLSGRLPFRGKSVSGQLACILTEVPENLRKALPNAPKALEEVLLSCLDRELEKRPQNVGQLARLLLPHAPAGAEASVERIELAADVESTSRLRPQQAKRSHGAQKRRQRRLWVATLAIACAAAVLGTLFLSDQLRAPASADSHLREGNSRPASSIGATDRKAKGQAPIVTPPPQWEVDGPLWLSPASAGARHHAGATVDAGIEAAPESAPTQIAPAQSASTKSAPTKRHSPRSKPRRPQRKAQPPKRTKPDAGLGGILDTRK